MKGFELESEKTMKKKGQGSTDFKILLVCWFDKKPVWIWFLHMSVCCCGTNRSSVRCYDQREKTYILKCHDPVL